MFLKLMVVFFVWVVAEPCRAADLYLVLLFGLGGCSAVALAVLGVLLLTSPRYLLLLLKHHTVV